jgi:hypothetical protein
MSALSVAAITCGTVMSLLIIAAFVTALVLSKRDYSLTATFKLAPRPAPRQAPAEQPAVASVPKQRGAA